MAYLLFIIQILNCHWNVVFIISEILTQTRGRQNLKCYDTKTGKVTKIIQLSTSDKKYLVETFVVWNILLRPPQKKKDRKTRGIFPKCNKSWILKHKFTYVLFLSQWKQFIKLFYGIIKISLKNVHFFYFALFCQFMQLHRSFV